MRVVFHIGAHKTDKDRLVRSLLKNREALLQHGILVPGPGRYRTVLRDVVNKLRGARPSPEAQDAIIDTIFEGDHVDTVFLSNESFICLPERILDDGRLYARAFKTTWLRNAFPDAKVDFAIGLRDPATFLPALYRDRKNWAQSFDDFLGGIDPMSLRWSEMIVRILDENPGSRVIAWCNEDTPLIWPAIMREVIGLDDRTPLRGVYDIAAQIMSKEGRDNLAAYIARYPPDTEMMRRRIVSAFLERFGLEDSIEQEIDVPGWTEAYVEQLTKAYDEDVGNLSRLSEVTLITP